MKNREKEIQVLAKAVIDSCILTELDSPHGDHIYCIFCHSNCSYTDENNNIEHNTDCPYLIAESLLK